MKKILMVLTSHSELDNTEDKTGVWIGEFTDPYYEFLDAGFDIALASTKGGEPPIDPFSALTENITASNRRFQDDEIAKTAFANTNKLEDINADDFDAVFFPGGHGPLWDLAKSKNCGELILKFKNADKPIAAVCHGSAAFIAAEVCEPGFLKGKTVTCFSNTEEKLVGKTDNVPYLLEDKLNGLGAIIDNAIIPFNSNVKVDGRLITGQNPLSAGPTADALIKMLS